VAKRDYSDDGARAGRKAFVFPNFPSKERPMFTIDHPRAEDGPAIDHLLDLAFGPDRLAKTAYRLRDGVPCARGLSFVARENGRLAASLQFWPVLIQPCEGSVPDEGSAPDEAGAPLPALLLGPLAVDPAVRGRGMGIALMRHGLDAATRQGHRAAILVGDLDYYSRVGFEREPAAGLTLPGPVEPARLLGINLVPGALDGVAGAVRPWPDHPFAA
jgi:predicted N-acetyltransferase YhbS